MLEDKIKELESLCKCSIMITINDHKCNYETVEEFFMDYDNPKEYDESDLKIMIEKDTIYNVHAYPDTPIGFYSFYHSDLSKCIDNVLNTIKKERC